MVRRRGSQEATSIPANLGAPSRIRQFLRLWAAEAELSEDVTTDLLIAASEAANNALGHTLTPTIECTWRLASDYVEVEIQDHGVYAASVPVAGQGGQASWGFRLMAAVADVLTVRAGTSEHPGTSVRFLKIVPRQGSGPRRDAGNGVRWVP